MLVLGMNVEQRLDRLRLLVRIGVERLKLLDHGHDLRVFASAGRLSPRPQNTPCAQLVGESAAEHILGITRRRPDLRTDFGKFGGNGINRFCGLPAREQRH